MQKHITEVRVGDIVLCKDGIERTVGKETIGGDNFIGPTLWGDSYKLGYEKVNVMPKRK